MLGEKLPRHTGSLQVYEHASPPRGHGTESSQTMFESQGSLNEFKTHSEKQG